MKFIINHLPTGKQESYRSTDWSSFESYLSDILNHKMGNEFEFIVDGKMVDFDTAVKASVIARQDWEAKRSLTKKQIWVLHGSCNLKRNWHQKWVKK